MLAFSNALYALGLTSWPRTVATLPGLTVASPSIRSLAATGPTDTCTGVLTASAWPVVKRTWRVCGPIRPYDHQVQLPWQLLVCWQSTYGPVITPSTKSTMATAVSSVRGPTWPSAATVTGPETDPPCAGPAIVTVGAVTVTVIGALQATL